MTGYWIAWTALYIAAGHWVITIHRAPGRHDPAAHLALVALWPLVALAMTLLELPSTEHDSWTPVRSSREGSPGRRQGPHAGGGRESRRPEGTPDAR